MSLSFWHVSNVFPLFAKHVYMRHLVSRVVISFVGLRNDERRQQYLRIKWTGSISEITSVKGGNRIGYRQIGVPESLGYRVK